MIDIESEQFVKNYAKIKEVIKSGFNTEYYSKIFRACGLYENMDFSFSDFKKIPIVDKKIYRENIFDLISSNCKFNKNFYKRLKNVAEKREYLEQNGLMLKITSGSTGIPLEVIKGQNDNMADYVNLQYYRIKTTNYNFCGKYLWIWPANPVFRKELYSTDKGGSLIKINEYGYQYMLYKFSEETFSWIYNLIIKKRIEWLSASPTVIVSFINYLREHKLCIQTIKYIECHSEKLQIWQRNLIKENFSCEVKSIYSSNEVQFMASSCEEDSFHVFTNSCFIEIDKTNKMGEVIVTSLLYKQVPIIRYRLGDCAEWITDSNNCCRLSKLPRIKLWGVRTNDYFINKDNKEIAPFVITDSITLICSSFKCTIDKYKVCQISESLIRYYFEQILVDKIQIKNY